MTKKKNRKDRLQKNKNQNRIKKIELTKKERFFGQLQILIIAAMIGVSIWFVITQVG